MTVSSASSKSPLYAGNDTTGPWAFAFKTFAASDLEVVRANASGIETVLALTTDYSVSLNADQNTNPGGTVTTVATVPTGSTIIVRWAGAATQGLDIQNAGGFYPEVIENSFDKLTMLVQKLAEETERALRVTITAGETVGTEIGGSASARANKYLGFNSSGNLTLSQSLDTGSVVISAYMETVLDDMDAPAALTTLGVSAFAQTLLDDASASAARTTLGLGNAATGTIGTDVQAYDADIPTVSASQAEMEAGTESALRSMSPLRVAQAIAALGVSGFTVRTPVTMATSSPTEIGFTSIPAGVSMVIVGFKGASTNGTSGQIIQLGHSGGYVVTGYEGTVEIGTTRAAHNTGFLLSASTTASMAHRGHLILVRMDAAGTEWSMHGNLSLDAGANGVYSNSGSVTLAGALDRIRWTTVGGTDVADGGTMNISYI